MCPFLVLKILKVKESCNGHNIYILESSPELQSILIPIPDLICPLDDDPNWTIITNIYNL